MGNVLITRHLETLDNRQERFSSGDRDVQILPGQAFPECSLAPLRSYSPHEILFVHTGMQRTIETVRVLAQNLNIDAPRTHALVSLRERFGGACAGLPLAELKSLFPILKEASAFWQCESQELNLESAAAFLERMREGLQDLKQLRNANPRIIVVAHAGTIKGLQAVLSTDSLLEQIDVLSGVTPQRHHFFPLTLS